MTNRDYIDKLDNPAWVDTVSNVLNNMDYSTIDKYPQASEQEIKEEISCWMESWLDLEYNSETFPGINNLE